MHRIPASPGGWNFLSQGFITLEQSPADIVFLSTADTDIQTLAAALAVSPSGFPSVRAANLLQLQQQLSIDLYAEATLSTAKIVILRLLGGRAYWSYGLEVVREQAQKSGTHLIVLPGDDRPDPDLVGHSTTAIATVHTCWRYLTEGGVENYRNALLFVADTCLKTHYNPPPPQPVPEVGVYPFPQKPVNLQGKVGILFYRAHYLAGNTAPIEALCQALIQRHLEPVPLFVSSLRDRACQSEILTHFQPQNISLILNTTSFAIGKPAVDAFLSRLNVPMLQVIFSSSTLEQWQSGTWGLIPRDVAMNVALPEVDGRIISRAVSFKGVQQWNDTLETDVVVYQPEAERIEFVAQLAQNWVKLRQTPPKDRRIALILANYPTRDGRLANGVGLDTPQSCVEILKALQAAGYTLEDIPQTSDELMQRLTTGVTNDPEGMHLRPIRQQLSPADYQAYFSHLPQPVQQGMQNRWGKLSASLSAECKVLSAEWEESASLSAECKVLSAEWEESASLSAECKVLSAEWEESASLSAECKVLSAEWEESVESKVLSSEKCGSQAVFTHSSSPHLPISPSPHPSSPNSQLPTPNSLSSPIPIPGIQLGNIFVGIQPARGYERDPALNYHAPDLEPTHEYLAFYHWLREHFQADAIAHIGKHGNLEWLPGKSIALSENCYPEVALGPLPHFYPFIVNDPGEGTQAKRRSQAVILDHLTPPLTRAELYGPLQQLENLIDEYYEAETLDPGRLSRIRDRIFTLIRQENLDQDLAGIRLESPTEFTAFLTQANGYLCELKEAQIRDGLHIFGQCPQGEQLRDLIIAISRSRPQGITRAIAQDWGLEFDPLTVDFAQPCVEEMGGWGDGGMGGRVGENLIFNSVDPELKAGWEKKNCHTLGDVVEVIELQAIQWVEQLMRGEIEIKAIEKQLPQTAKELTWMNQVLLPALQQTSQEITQLLRGFDGQFVESGPSGAPTRDRADVLPTGRNFYSVDIRSLPTETAWDIGRKAAEALIERYTQENGEYPKTLGLSVWGTSTMRTGGDDIAEALALLGVRPVWDGASRRVVDFEILPVSALGRPRVDVTLRISGFFRDAFSHLIDLFDSAVNAVASLDEPPEDNPLAAQVQQEEIAWVEAGLSVEQAKVRSRYRVFGSKPGAYGAGLQGLIESQNWQNDQDLATAYLNWSGYAYTKTPTLTGELSGTSAPEAFKNRLQQMQIVLHNQDNREHDLLDSDDYYQFQGGLTVAVRALTGKNPQTYFGDHSVPQNPRIRKLQEEIARVYRSRVINPKWIAGVMRHGYKGAFEIAATVDYLFAYDATTHCVADYMYQGVTQAYVFNPEVQAFILEKNPWALRDIAERLLEAHQRGLWEDVTPHTLDQLRAVVNHAEGQIESL
ncbi:MULTISPECIES: cobaltochelatase subunit CobN [Desertifilum]|uniref:Cobaltochelatase subunit CobN n=1 Tax=Desertifilum tharense IPPAS B-1220 TaxID=1781255 RepID=A0A1E5QLU2_9CYAN|nr:MULTISPECIES: cobaltochelatase subunit CobN [Desertifilum]OEJ75646.1 cobaltochelatase subunit CobN [Desertifilum tharense IPPAS B-1220]